MWNMKIKQFISTPAKITASIAIVILIVSIIGISFWLMNQQDTLAFIAGILLFIFTLAFTINLIYITIKNNFKKQS